MDRLICGDVGYGKTEVAMRAAFKAVMDGKQVAILAPTTVLAFQHLRTLTNRFTGFPVRIDMVSRFRSKQEQKETLTKLAAGQLDIIVGTHRLLSKDVVFRDLGLLIVDEAFAPCSLGAEIAAQMADIGFDFLDAPIRRLNGAFAPTPYSPTLEPAVIPSQDQIAAAIRALISE